MQTDHVSGNWQVEVSDLINYISMVVRYWVVYGRENYQSQHDAGRSRW